MRGQDIKLLRERSIHNYSNREMAQMLGINERTLINWESSEDALSKPYQVFLGQIFEDVLIDVTQKILNNIFEIVPAEHMGLWFYMGHSKLALFRNSSRHHNVSGSIKESYTYTNDEIIKDLDDTSLTTASLAYAVTINDAGESITSNRYKAYQGTRYAHYLSNRTLESILKLPRFMKGPSPLYLFSAENKLKKVGKNYEVIVPDEGENKVFTEEDMSAIIDALEKHENEELTDLLTMFYH